MWRYVLMRVLAAVACSVVLSGLHSVRGHAATADALSYSSFWQSGTGSPQYSTSMNAAVAELAILNASGGTNGLCTDQAEPRSSTIASDTYAYNGGTNHACGGGFATFQVSHSYQCSVGGSTHQWSSTPGAGCTMPTNTCPASAGQFATGWSASTYWDLGTGLTDASGNPLPVFGVSGGGNYCANGCVATFQASGGTVSAQVAGAWHVYEQGGFKVASPGTACSSSGAQPSPVGAVPTNSCAAGQDGGTVNGKWVCIDRLTGNVVPNDANGDGKPDNCEPGSGVSGGVTYTTTYNSTTNICSVSGSDGSSCVGFPGTCTNAAAATPGGGVCVGSGCEVQPAGGAGGGGAGGTPPPTADSCASNPGQTGCGNTDFCKMHPTLSVCIVSTYSGACGGSISCTGDAIACQMAREQQTRNCQLYGTAPSDADPVKVLGDAALSSGDPKASEFPDPTTPISVPVGTVDQTELFTGSCPSSLAFTAMGQAVTIPLTDSFCYGAAILGNIGVICSLVAAALIIGKGDA
jgi:hypothetical protein